MKSTRSQFLQIPIEVGHCIWSDLSKESFDYIRTTIHRYFYIQSESVVWTYKQTVVRELLAIFFWKEYHVYDGLLYA